MFDKILLVIEKLTPTKWRWIFKHEGIRRYSANTVWMFIGQLFSLIVAFFIGVWLARYLGPYNYGIISYALALAGLFAFIADLGTGGIISRDLVKSPEKRDELLGTGFRLKLIGGTIAFLAATIAALVIKSDPLTKVLIVLYSTSFILAAINIIIIFFQAEVKAKKTVQAQVMATIISSILKVLLILFGLGVFWLTLIYVFDVVWQGIGFIWVYEKYGLRIRQWRFNPVLAKEIWRNAWPLMLSTAASVILLRIDQVMIGNLMDKKAVGIYAAAVKIVEIFYFVPSIICASLFPAIINAKKTGVEMYQRRLRNLYFLMGVIGILIALPISLLAKPIISILFGANYLLAVPILQIYIWSGVGLFLGFAVNQYLMAENATRTIFWVNLAAMLANVLLNVWLIPMVGLSGAAIATLISYFVIPVLVWLRDRIKA